MLSHLFLIGVKSCLFLSSQVIKVAYEVYYEGITNDFYQETHKIFL